MGVFVWCIGVVCVLSWGGLVTWIIPELHVPDGALHFPAVLEDTLELIRFALVPFGHVHRVIEATARDKALLVELLFRLLDGSYETRCHVLIRTVLVALLESLGNR